MRIENQQELSIFMSAPDGILVADGGGRIKMANPALEVLTGYSGDDVVGKNVDVLLPADIREKHAQAMRTYFDLPRSRAMGSMDLQILRRDGQLLSVDISVGHFRDGHAHFAIIFVRDVSVRKKLEESIRHQAAHDELTGLPNRWLFRLQIGQALIRADRSKLRVAVLFIDLDHFKAFNDSYGHATGDALLVQVSERMRGVVRGSDTLARMGGDEFALLLSEITCMEEAIGVATKLLMALQASYKLNDNVLYSGASLGVAFYPDDARDGETLLRYADLAMYQAKHAGRGTYARYSNELDIKVHESMQLHTRLKDAISQDLLELHYQPQVGVDSGLIVGVEALLRWNDPIFGQVSPIRFIPVAEATGLILPLSAWVLRTACNQIAIWSKRGTPLRVAVNFSAQQFRQRDFPEQVRLALAVADANADLLDIEITESVAMAQPELAREHICALVKMGCRVALDDFGTGYSSLAYLKVLPVSKLKIDKTFMDGIPLDVGDVTISRAIIALAHNLGMTLVAEGVESEEQLEFLHQNDCEIYQGWLYSKAINAQEMTAMLESERVETD